MKNIIIAFALLTLTLCATSDAAITSAASPAPQVAAVQGDAQPASAGLTLSKFAGMRLPSHSLRGDRTTRSDIPLGANMISAARSVQHIEGGKTAGPAPSVLAKEASLSGFGPIPSSAALGLLIVALLLLPFMGRVELH